MADLNSTLIRGNLRVIEDVNISGVLSAASIKEGDTALSSKYLGISAKAADSDLLDGHDSSYFINTSNIGSQSVSYANSAGSATSASSADYATSAGSAGSATTAGSADYIVEHNFSSEDSAMPSEGARAGIFYGTTSSTGSDGALIGFNWTDATHYGAQLFIDCDPTYHIALRQRDSNGNWNSWVPIITGNNIGSQSVNYATSAGSASSATTAASADYATSAGSASSATTATSAGSADYATSAGNADTVDGYHASDFAASNHNHYSLTTEGDNRAVATAPNDYNNLFKFSGLKTNSYIGSPSGDLYSYVLGLRGWSDSSGGNAYELAFNNTNIYFRNGATDSWGSWNSLVHSGNIGSQNVDQVDGKHASDFVYYLGAPTATPDNVDTITNPGGANAFSIRTRVTSGHDMGVLYLSDDNAYICNSSDEGYNFAVFDTDRTVDFSNINNAEFAVVGTGLGCKINGNTVIHAGNVSSYVQNVEIIDLR